MEPAAIESRVSLGGESVAADAAKEADKVREEREKKLAGARKRASGRFQTRRPLRAKDTFPSVDRGCAPRLRRPADGVSSTGDVDGLVTGRGYEPSNREATDEGLGNASLERTEGSERFFCPLSSSRGDPRIGGSASVASTRSRSEIG